VTIPTGALERLADMVDPPEHRYATTPAEWVHDRLSERLWSKQREIAESVRDNRYTAVKSAHATGKSHVASRLVAWWLDVHPVGDAFAVTTAPTQSQVEAILWREIGRAHRRGGLRGRITAGNVPAWKIGDELVAFGRKPADYTDADEAAATFQGVHARHVLIVLDEAAGVPPWLYDAADTLATNEHARILAIGNPTDPASKFAKVCAPGSGWNTLSISAFDTPAFTGETVALELLELLVGPTWVEERRKRWGEGSPMWLARVLGEFPPTSDDTVIQLAAVEAAQLRELVAASSRDEVVIACDVARFGSDETVIATRVGPRVRVVDAYAGKPTTHTAGRIIDEARSHPHVRIVVDDVGVGGGVTDMLREHGLDVVAFNGGERAYRPDEHPNRRSEIWFSLQDAIGGLDLDDDEQLAADLSAPRYSYDSRGRRVVEAKAETKRRLGRSPDRADAVLLTLVGPADYVPVEPREMLPSLTGHLLEEPW
jgi:hypothetical protein